MFRTLRRRRRPVQVVRRLGGGRLATRPSWAAGWGQSSAASARASAFAVAIELTSHIPSLRDFPVVLVRGVRGRVPARVLDRAVPRAEARPPSHRVHELSRPLRRAGRSHPDHRPGRADLPLRAVAAGAALRARDSDLDLRARLLQVHAILGRELGRTLVERRDCRARRHGDTRARAAAAGHLVLRLRVRPLPVRRRARQPADPQPAPFRPVRDLLAVARGRPDPSGTNSSSRRSSRGSQQSGRRTWRPGCSAWRAAW